MNKQQQTLTWVKHNSLKDIHPAGDQSSQSEHCIGCETQTNQHPPRHPAVPDRVSPSLSQQTRGHDFYHLNTLTPTERTRRLTCEEMKSGGRVRRRSSAGRFYTRARTRIWSSCLWKRRILRPMGPQEAPEMFGGGAWFHVRSPLRRYKKGWKKKRRNPRGSTPFFFDLLKVLQILELD